MLGLRNILVALCALFVGAGHSVCATPIAASAEERSLHAAHGAHHQDGRASPRQTPEFSCEHCQIAHFAGAPDARLKAPIPASGALAAFFVSPTLSRPAAMARLAATGLRPEAPPGATPVSLKIRLRN